MGDITVELFRGSGSTAIAIGLRLPSAELRPYVSTYYLTEVTGGEPVADHLHPEWGNLRFTADGEIRASMGPGPLAPTPRFVAAGPTSRATGFELAPGRYWGIGLLPLGWARFVGVPAGERADCFFDVLSDDAFASFRPLVDRAWSDGADRAREVAAIDAHMHTLLASHGASDDEARIHAIHAALVDPAVTTAAEIARRAAMPLRSLERFARAAFGFTPKLLLRRQRFLRTLAQFMLDPSLAWLETLDDGYYDQAHFIRDFRRFMGMTPSAYAAQPHPILGAAAHARTAAAGQAMQSLHAPHDDGQALR